MPNSLENYAIARDPRSCGPVQAPTLYTDAGEIDLPGDCHGSREIVERYILSHSE